MAPTRPRVAYTLTYLGPCGLTSDTLTMNRWTGDCAYRTGTTTARRAPDRYLPRPAAAAQLRAMRRLAASTPATLTRTVL